jgi:predicted  nucleic acid-binding Zn-ribbon protein
MLAQNAMPWAVAIAAILALLIFFSQGNARPAFAATSGSQPNPSAAEMTDRFAASEARIERLASAIEILTEKLAASRAHDKVASPKIEHQATDTARSRAAVEADLEKLRQYVKDVANSVAVLDTQISDPAVLQKQIDRQKALIRP